MSGRHSTAQHVGVCEDHSAASGITQKLHGPHSSVAPEQASAQDGPLLSTALQRKAWKKSGGKEILDRQSGRTARFQVLREQSDSNTAK